MNHTYKILKYLYKNNDGRYLDIRKAYSKKELPSDELLARKFMELASFKLINSRSVYEDRGLLEVDTDTQLITMIENTPESFSAMISIEGEDYIDEKTIKFFGRIVQKRNFWITAITGIIIFVTAIINIIFNLLRT